VMLNCWVDRMAVSGVWFVGFNPTLIDELETRAGRAFEGFADISPSLGSEPCFERMMVAISDDKVSTFTQTHICGYTER